MSNSSPLHQHELYIDFDGQQLVITSDDPRALAYFRRKYVHMIVPAKSRPLATLSVQRDNGGYVVNGTEKRRHEDALDSLFDYLCHDVFQSFLLYRFDLVWLHAGAVEKNGSAVVIAGNSGHGKSTFVTHLAQRGWKMLSDEYAPISPATNEVFPYPRTPRRRVFPGRELAEMEYGAFEMEHIEIPAHAIRRNPARVGTMVFPYFKVGQTTRLERLSGGDAVMEFIRNTTNFVHHRRSGFEWVVGLVKQIESYRITYSSGADAVATLDAELAGRLNELNVRRADIPELLAETG